MTLLSMAQQIVEESGFQSPASIIGNAELTAVRLHAVAVRTGRQLIREVDGNWSFQVLTTTITTSASTSSYAIPSDMLDMMDDTLWDRTNFWEVRGRLTPAQWQARKSGIIGSGPAIRKLVRLRPDSNGVRRLHVTPVPTTAETIAFDYITRNWILRSSGSSLSETFAADADTVLFDEGLFELGLKWRFLNSMGMGHSEAKGDYLDARDAIFGRDQGTAPFSLGGDPPLEPFLGVHNIPEQGFG